MNVCVIVCVCVFSVACTDSTLARRKAMVELTTAELRWLRTQVPDLGIYRVGFAGHFAILIGCRLRLVRVFFLHSGPVLGEVLESPFCQLPNWFFSDLNFLNLNLAPCSSMISATVPNRPSRAPMDGCATASLG